MSAPLRVLVSAGPTREFIDPVRFLSNPSTGKMGVAVCAVAAAAGHAVTLVLGPTHLAAPAGVQVVRVVSAAEMCAAVLAQFDACDVLVMTAAVADFRPVSCAPVKQHKADAPLTLAIAPTDDILMAAAARMQRQVLIGFAAETGAGLASAARKLREKHLDLIVANDVQCAQAGFGAEHLRAWALWRGGAERDLGLADKNALAAFIVAEAERLAGERLLGI
jgi:phosphopantothenoylcysteine decarboxylase/phosphopantothenate--cysteine ligase